MTVHTFAHSTILWQKEVNIVNFFFSCTGSGRQSVHRQETIDTTVLLKTRHFSLAFSCRLMFLSFVSLFYFEIMYAMHLFSFSNERTRNVLMYYIWTIINT